MPLMFCCSKACCVVLSGNKISRGKGQLVVKRYEEWVTNQLGTSLRVGSRVDSHIVLTLVFYELVFMYIYLVFSWP